MADTVTQGGDAEKPFMERLAGALASRRAFLERSEVPKLKDEFRAFHTGLSTVYALFSAKGYITEDPYKNDVKMGEIKLPENGPVTDANRRDQLGRRLSHLDNQFDFLCNFFQLGADTLDQETIKRIMALVRFIEWNRLSVDSKSPSTVAIAGIVTTARKSVGDTAQAAKLSDALFSLEKGTDKIAKLLKTMSDFNREQYKYDVRLRVTENLSDAQKQIGTIKTKFEGAFPGEPFYKELVEELIQEDTGAGAAALRDALFKRLAVADDKPKAGKKAPALKPILIQGINIVGGAGPGLLEILAKITENHTVMQSRKKSVLEKIAGFIAQVTNKEPEPVIYEFDLFDTAKGVSRKIKLNFNAFSQELEKKSRILCAMAARGQAAHKLEAMDESQLVSLLQKNLRDLGGLHKTLTGLDEFFKNGVDKSLRGRVKGIKPDLSALKNAQTNGNQKLIDYEATKEEEEQFRRLGIDPAR